MTVATVKTMRPHPGNNRLPWTLLSREIANRVQVLREMKGWSQNELERQAGVARGSVSRIESGERGRWLMVETVLALANALDVDVGWLITGSPPDPRWSPPMGFSRSRRPTRQG